MEKSNWKIHISLLHCYIVALLLLLIYTRFINLGWGLPYPMHPDERNMANAVQNLNCDIRNCLKPNFYAYGQFPLYLAYLLSKIFRFEPTMALRLISAVASIFAVFVLIKLVKLISNKITNYQLLITSLLFIFSPALIQFAHFGTTESLLMLFYSLITYYSLRVSYDRRILVMIFWLSLWSGMAVATKVSAGIFIILPFFVLLSKHKIKSLITFCILTVLFSFIFSPYNLIAFNEFYGSIKYESDVALGRYIVFYTRQFIGAIPVVFQFTKIFPYALGWPVMLLAGLGMLGWLGKLRNSKEVNILRLAFFIYFIPNAFIFAKWTRFIAPVMPLMIVFAVLAIVQVKVINIIKVIIVIIAIIPGIVYLRVYYSPDVRFSATEWINKNIPKNSVILSETANVVDVPFNTHNYRFNSFDFYNLDSDARLQQELKNYLVSADYIIVPSRRIFMNHPVKIYPVLNDYYKKLFSGKLGFTPVAEFEVNKGDEQAEETWSVFDHPTIRIYKRK